jgi:hypothetical protein
MTEAENAKTPPGYDGSDWYDTTPIETDTQERERRAQAARQRLDAGAADGRIPESCGQLASYAWAVKLDADRIGRVMLAAWDNAGPGYKDVDPDDLTAALQLITPLRGYLDALECDLMGLARRQWMTWRDIAGPLGLQSPQAAAQRWERFTGATAPAVDAVRRKLIDALRDGGIKRGEARIFVGGKDDDRAVIIQLAANGSPEVRRGVAERLIEVVRGAGLDVTDEGSHSETDMAAYLADAGTAEVYEVAAGHAKPST